MRAFAITGIVVLVLGILGLGLLMASMYGDYARQQPLAAQYGRLKAATDAALMENTQLRRDIQELETLNDQLEAENEELREQQAEPE